MSPQMPKLAVYLYVKVLLSVSLLTTVVIISSLIGPHIPDVWLRRSVESQHEVCRSAWFDSSWHVFFFFVFNYSFSPSGAVNPSSAPFISPSTPHSSFLPPAHLGENGFKRHIFAPQPASVAVIHTLQTSLWPVVDSWESSLHQFWCLSVFVF